MVWACGEPGAAIAVIALPHGINANIVHRWVRERGTSGMQQGFLPMPVLSAMVSNDVDAAAIIEIQLRSGATVALIRCPLQDADASATVLPQWAGCLQSAGYSH